MDYIRFLIYDQPMDDLMTRESAAAALGVSLSTVQRMCGDGRLTAVKVSRRAVRVTAASVEAVKTGHAPKPVMHS